MLDGGAGAMRGARRSDKYGLTSECFAFVEKAGKGVDKLVKELYLRVDAMDLAQSKLMGLCDAF